MSNPHELDELQALVAFLPPLSMNPISRHLRDDHRECPAACPKWGMDLRPAPVFMDLWLEHPVSSIRQ